MSEVEAVQLSTGEHVILVRTPEVQALLLAHWHSERYVDLNAIKIFQIDSETSSSVDISFNDRHTVSHQPSLSEKEEPGTSPSRIVCWW